MIQRGTSVIVSYRCGWGRSTSAEVAPYCATKWAVEGMTQALAEELPADMVALSLNPGIFRTQMLKRCFGFNAAAYPSSARWARKAVPFLLKLQPGDNGKPLTAPS